MHSMEKVTDDNLTIWIKFFFYFYCELSFIKLLILNYSNSSFWCIYQ